MEPSPDKRKGERLEHELPVAYRSVDGFISDWATNISKGGLFINTKKPLPVGTSVRLVFELPSIDVPFSLAGRVVRVLECNNPDDEAPGMALEFVDIDGAKRTEIEEFVGRLCKQL